MGETFDKKKTLELHDVENFEQEQERQEGIETAIVEIEIDKLATIRPISMPITTQLATHIMLQHAEIKTKEDIIMRVEITKQEGRIVNHVVQRELGNWNVKQKQIGMNGNS